jgi:dolichyl-phosphate-mannose--protein O-mannosyl transferase
MNAQTEPTPAEVADRTLQLLAGSMFALALIFCLSVAEFFANESTAAVIDIFVKILGVTVLALMGLLYFWKFRPMTVGQRRDHLAEDGFLQTAFRKAMAQSWMLTFLALVILQVLDEWMLARLSGVPLEITIKAVLALMLLLFSLAFLLITRPGSSDE